MEGVSATSSAQAPASLPYGLKSCIGNRERMEDAVIDAPRFLSLATAAGGTHALDFFAVYDGHGGSEVAEVCRRTMHVVLAEEAARSPALAEGAEATAEWWREVMLRSFRRVDGEVMETAKERSEMRMAGSTAVVAVVGPGRIVVANCGDSRAVLYRGGEAIALTADHKVDIDDDLILDQPERDDELKRIKEAGGEAIDWNGYRVMGILAISRSIGDYYLKPYVIADPEVTVIDRTEEDEFLILASDGLWDALSNKSAGQVTRHCLSGKAAKKYPQLANKRSVDVAAMMLAKFAIANGSMDNVSVVVIQLKRMEETSTPM